ncbi:phosphohydrolase, partial [Vibrio parahaemolyticus]|nr:phosphohydrolase [Vibrio parahaemolyticus]
LQPHAVDTERKSKNPKKPRYIDAWRNVLHLSEEDVWQILSDWRITPPVPYRLGWGRSSCKLCIFSSDRVLATINEYWPEKILEVADYEDEFGVTIARSGKNVLDRATSTTPFIIDDEEALQQSFQKE